MVWYIIVHTSIFIFTFEINQLAASYNIPIVCINEKDLTMIKAADGMAPDPSGLWSSIGRRTQHHRARTLQDVSATIRRVKQAATIYSTYIGLNTPLKGQLLDTIPQD
jgi:hypothetical protein